MVLEHLAAPGAQIIETFRAPESSLLPFLVPQTIELNQTGKPCQRFSGHVATASILLLAPIRDLALAFALIELI